MLTDTDIAVAVIERIKAKANYTLTLLPTMALSESPLSLDDTQLRRLADALRNLVKRNNPNESVTKSEVVSGKLVRGVVALIVKKISGRTLDTAATDKCIADAQSPGLPRSGQ